MKGLNGEGNGARRRKHYDAAKKARKRVTSWRSVFLEKKKSGTFRPAKPLTPKELPAQEILSQGGHSLEQPPKKSAKAMFVQTTEASHERGS